MFDKILIANRGEIACRIIRSAKQLGIRTVAIYSTADRDACHVALADESYCVGGAPAKESYLRGQSILEVALQSGAQAIHPGYGFLAENAEFATACSQAGLVFIGPSAEAIEAMGDKARAKQLMETAGVPLVPGYHGSEQSPQHLQRAAKQIGFPLLIKASAGGGGKGMRVVDSAGEFAEALAAARREAEAAFGDQTVLLERYLQRPRHIEIQIFADSQGQVLHLFERDCSVQRRHQKVLEEAPAPGLSAELRSRMGEAAVRAARAIDYQGAGTVEFLLDQDGSFYFMEMNTRLQVEHPVTEMITGQDLVAWQLQVADGQPLPCTQQQLSISGHAIEARIYAEDAARDFLPATGKLQHLRLPRENTHVRIDSGVEQGSRIDIHYDPMIAKLIVWDQDRQAALRRLQQALADYQVVGVTTNLGFLSAVTLQEDFAAGRYDTNFIEQHRAELLPDSQPATETVLALACLEVLLRRSSEAREAAGRSDDPYSPWHATSGWRLNCDNHHDLCFRDGDQELSIRAHYRQDAYLLDLPSGSLLVRGQLEANGDLLADLAGRRLKATVVRQGDELCAMGQGQSHRLILHDPYAPGMDQESEGGSLTAPMPGKIVAVLADSGAQVKRGTPLVILEAMKMEHTITAPCDGLVTRMNFGAGELVDEGTQLLAFEAEGGG